MAEESPQINRFGWWLILYVAACATVLNFFILISSFFDLGEIAYLFLCVPILSLLMVILVVFAAVREKRMPGLPVFLSFPVYWVISWVLFTNMDAVRTHARWFLESRGYKAQVLAQPEPGNGELRHIEWDGWGWAGMDTSVYLVYDPADSLAVPASNHSSGKFRGIPCVVPRVRRLESHWYSVKYYTGATWNQCT